MGLLDYTNSGEITIGWLGAHDWHAASGGLFSEETTPIPDGIIVANKIIKDVSCGAFNIHIILQFIRMNEQSTLTMRVVMLSNASRNHPMVTLPVIVTSNIKTTGDLLVAERIAEDKATEQTIEYIEGKDERI